MTRRARYVSIALLGAALLGAQERGHRAPGGPEGAQRKATGPQEDEGVAVFLNQSAQQPIVILRGKRDGRSLEMVIGLPEMVSIAVPLQGVTPPRPLTHDLFLTLFGRLKVKLTRVVINDFRDDIYYATVYLTAGGSALPPHPRPPHAALPPPPTQ